MSPKNTETTIITTMTLKFQPSIFALLLSISLCSTAFSASKPGSTHQPSEQELISHFNIPAQPLLDALLEYGMQAHISIIFPTEGSSISSYRSTSIMGKYPIDQALKRLLSKTPYTFKLNQQTQSITLNTTIIADSHITSSTSSNNQDYPLEEVFVVSARHRPENLQDVPMSISLFSSERLEQNGIQDFIELGSYAANTTLKLFQGTNSTMSAFIRGVGYKDPIAGVEMGVGIYIDDVYIHRPQGVTIDIYDMERIEILRGPQGTLYGRNTTGGAIKYTTKRLEDEARLSLKLSGGSYNQRDLIATGSTPISDGSLKIGGSIASFYRKGFGSNLTTGDENYNKEILALRSTIEITPSDNVFIRIAGDLTKDTSSPKSGKVAFSDNEESALDNIYDTRGGIANSNHPINGNYVSIRGISTFSQWTASEDFTITFINAYRQDRGEIIIDNSALASTEDDYFSIQENHQASQEIRIAFDNQKIHAFAGLYYLNANSFSAIDVVQPPPPPSIGFIRVNFDIRTCAVFGTVDIELSDTLNVSIGARYTRDKKTMSSFKNLYSPTSSGDLISPYFGGDGFAYFDPEYDDEGNEVFPHFRATRNDSATTPRLSLSWQPNKEVHLYTSYSKGFTSGGFDSRGIYTQPSIRKGFEPETIDSYELGLKSLFLEGGVTSNVAIFYSYYKNAQVLYEVEYASVSPVLAGATFVTIKNAAEATISGLELEVKARFSNNLTSNLAIGLIKADYTSYDEGSGDVSDQRVLQDTPERTASLSLQYKSTLGSGELSITSSINYRSISSFNRQELGRSRSEQPGYSLVNSSIVWASDSNTWQVSMHAKNISNKQYKVSGYTGPSANIAADIYGSPRTITATVKYRL